MSFVDLHRVVIAFYGEVLPAYLSVVLGVQIFPASCRSRLFSIVGLIVRPRFGKNRLLYYKMIVGSRLILPDADYV